MRRRALFFLVSGLVSALGLSGCIFLGEYDDKHGPVDRLIAYEVCYADFECAGGAGAHRCEELAVPIGPATLAVGAICTGGCFDWLDCPVSAFNGLPGACVDHGYLGGPIASGVCVERCEIDLDCDIAAGFGCEGVARDRVCLPIR